MPHLTSLYHNDQAAPYGDRGYPGNCGGNLIKDLLRFYRPRSVFDPMTGSGTCRDVCKELGIYCYSSDLREGKDACDVVARSISVSSTQSRRSARSIASTSRT